MDGKETRFELNFEIKVSGDQLRPKQHPAKKCFVSGLVDNIQNVVSGGKSLGIESSSR